MKNRGQIILGAVLTLVGLLLLLGRVLHVDLSAFCIPIGLIAIGAIILIRPYVVSPDTHLSFRPFAGINRRGDWRVQDEEIWIFVGDVNLDLTYASIPPGGARIRLYGFISDMNMTVPDSAPVRVASSAVVTDAKTPDGKEDHFFSTALWQTTEYESAEDRLDVDVVTFITDLNIRQT